ncbi:sterol desaturase family protein [Parachitinimonas caeni]|uniref:Sterol desaturase family protein n=1 Tax=Parachitinimonas caeni TaxID=3031301 RepID=A0ABT7E2Q6_9NEIS|nr:sterol desaturase family protein [Parachitinimonas caeni]MDK2126583.1 sterol desaturase family protein [Parachitinimonas caeni]
MRPLITYGFYPVIASMTIVFAWFNFTGQYELQLAFSIFTASRFVLFIVAEIAWPCRPEWSMTWTSFLRDLKYMVAGGALLQVVKFATAWLAIGAAQSKPSGLATLPLLLQVVIALLVYELLQYGIHRYSHEGRGALGRFLWRIHAVHHLPQRVYFLMHPVMHPINMLIVVAIGLVPSFVLGINREAVFMFNLILGVQGLFSHFNVDIRVGPLNYLLIGTELHRCHHSSELEEAGNYGAVIPFWDLVFGSFSYAGGKLPRKLGIADSTPYPSSNQYLDCLALPFRGHRPDNHDGKEP